jgi:hypothetical protein
MCPSTLQLVDYVTTVIEIPEQPGLIGPHLYAETIRATISGDLPDAVEVANDPSTMGAVSPLDSCRNIAIKLTVLYARYDGTKN